MTPFLFRLMKRIITDIVVIVVVVVYVNIRPIEINEFKLVGL